jgi:DNA-directed RNA polymerase sigma subunit (sigma70/sigma32)
MVLEEKLGREATPEEIAEDTGLALDEVLSVMELMEEIASQDNVEAAAEEETAETEDADAESEEPRTRWDAGRRTNS